MNAHSKQRVGTQEPQNDRCLLRLWPEKCGYFIKSRKDCSLAVSIVYLQCRLVVVLRGHNIDCDREEKFLRIDPSFDFAENGLVFHVLVLVQVDINLGEANTSKIWEISSVRVAGGALLAFGAATPTCYRQISTIRCGCHMAKTG